MVSFNVQVHGNINIFCTQLLGGFTLINNQTGRIEFVGLS
jgi:hypothetical protein